MASKQPPKTKSTPKQQEAPAKKPNVFKPAERKVHLHATPLPELQMPKPKTFSLFPEDLERLNSLRDELQKHSKRHVPDSQIIRIALSCFADQLKAQKEAGGSAKHIRDLLYDHR